MGRSRLVPSLFSELVETERSSYRRPVREAERLGDVAPSIALRAVAAHANDTLDALPKLARARGLSTTTVRGLFGAAVASAWDAAAAHLVDVERSFRTTLLGLRNGIDLVRLLRAAADDEADHELVAWCDRWLDVRQRLVQDVARELDWFAQHPAASLRVAASLAGA